MSTTPKLNFLVLGSSEIARMIIHLSRHATCSITVCDDHVDQHTWPEGIVLRPFNFSDQPWTLDTDTHALIARGHEGDAENLLSLLHHRAEHVYLIASAKRSQSIIDQVEPQLSDPALLYRLSAPAGLNLGGQSSYEIAQSVLAEIQWRSNQRPELRPLSELRHGRINKSTTGQRNQSCPGKRP